jgi:hypothetical protein
MYVFLSFSQLKDNENSIINIEEYILVSIDPPINKLSRNDLLWVFKRFFFRLVNAKQMTYKCICRAIGNWREMFTLFKTFFFAFW